jgi:hypothetical protein
MVFGSDEFREHQVKLIADLEKKGTAKVTYEEEEDSSSQQQQQQQQQQQRKFVRRIVRKLTAKKMNASRGKQSAQQDKKEPAPSNVEEFTERCYGLLVSSMLYIFVVYVSLPVWLSDLFACVCLLCSIATYALSLLILIVRSSLCSALRLFVHLLFQV